MTVKDLHPTLSSGTCNPQKQFPAVLVTFAEDILNRKLNFLCGETLSPYISVLIFIYLSSQTGKASNSI